jgi:hypothetical protein
MTPAPKHPTKEQQFAAEPRHNDFEADMTPREFWAHYHLSASEYEDRSNED